MSALTKAALAGALIALAGEMRSDATSIRGRVEFLERTKVKGIGLEKEITSIESYADKLEALAEQAGVEPAEVKLSDVILPPAGGEPAVLGTSEVQTEVNTHPGFGVEMTPVEGTPKGDGTFSVSNEVAEEPAPEAKASKKKTTGS